jgi:hypothetical protein
MTRRLLTALGFGTLVAAVAWTGCAAGVVSQNQNEGGGGEGGKSTTTTTTSGGGAKDAGQNPPPWDGGTIVCNEAKDCAALNGACVQGACINGVCEQEPANQYGACDDGLFCTEDDTCVDGFCEGGTQKLCASQDACHIGVCDEDLQTCKNIAGNDGAQCDDMDLCTQTGLCSGGVCSKGAPVDCSIFNGQCTVGACDPAVGCYGAPASEGLPCDDGLFCNVQETCQNGVCAGGMPNPCAPPGGCYIASCDEGNDACSSVPGNDGQACDDFSPCTESTTCLNGACINGAPVNDGMACDDGTSCTTGEFCTNGTCGGGVGPEVYFGDTFADQSKGWVLGPEWQIGPAQMSSGGVYGADPANDHTPSIDNGVAGVVIGGNASTTMHGYYYLESPPFNSANAAGQVIFGFYRWLNSDYDPYMHNSVDVWNGSSWVNLWTSGGPPGVEDSPPNGMGWTFIQHDVTAYKSAAMRVRFGFDIQSLGVFTIGSWNVDDVLIASQPCP